MSAQLLQALAVGVGAAAGALLRWLAAVAFNRPGSTLPMGTLLVNCAGGFVIGALLVVFERWPNDLARLLLITGFLGGLTTFSAFSAESLALLIHGDWPDAIRHTFAHVAGALACAALGWAIARTLLA